MFQGWGARASPSGWRLTEKGVFRYKWSHTVFCKLKMLPLLCDHFPALGWWGVPESHSACWSLLVSGHLPQSSVTPQTDSSLCLFFLNKTGLNLEVQWKLTQIKFQNFVRVVGDTPGSRQSTYHLVTTKISMEKVVLEFTQTCASLTELIPG